MPTPPLLSCYMIAQLGKWQGVGLELPGPPLIMAIAAGAGEGSIHGTQEAPEVSHSHGGSITMQFAPVSLQAPHEDQEEGVVAGETARVETLCKDKQGKRKDEDVLECKKHKVQIINEIKLQQLYYENFPCLD
ncbi:UNVERIFIED_CONTAM: hypothetical protein K2H54_023349 [Gekko kuhli]